MNDNYLGSGNLLKLAIKKYGVDYFKKEILFIFDNKNEMFEAEKELVNAEFLSNNNTYNLQIGGDGSFHYINKSNLSSNKLAAKYPLYKKIISERIKIGLKRVNFKHDTFKGKKHSNEYKKMLSENNKITSKGSRNSQFGTCWIYNLELKENKKIKIGQLDEYIDLGWTKGRKYFNMQ